MLSCRSRLLCRSIGPTTRVPQKAADLLGRPTPRRNRTRWHPYRRRQGRGDDQTQPPRLPIILKDNINTVGFPTTAGTPFLKGYRPKTNAPLAEMLFKQGAILFAKSNMHELALGGTSANPTFGYVKNHYDLSHIPGSSSGGTAAAIAARIVPLGIGSDTAGSIRIPAHFLRHCRFSRMSKATSRGTIPSTG
jgi:Asp-tRNA(Asn)/Glu-tRNA(Gln) amidotransferase A subunit family amidase